MTKVIRVVALVALTAGSVVLSAAPAAAATRTWDGGGTDNNWSTAANWDTDTAPVAGDTLVFPPGVADVVTDNDFPDGTSFTITVTGAGYVFTGNDLAGTIEVAGDPAVTLTLTAIVVDSVISGAGGLTLNGATLNGANTYTGATSVGAGTSAINGAQPSSDLTITSADGALSGNGTTKALNGGGGEIRLDQNQTLTVQGAFTSSTDVHFFEFNGTTPGTNQAQLVVNGTVALADGANLVVDDPAPPPDPGTEIVLVANDGADPVTGKFKAVDGANDGVVLEEGDLERFGGNGIYELSYAGGDGNDISITAIGLPIFLAGSALGPPDIDVFVPEGERIGLLPAEENYPGFGGGINVALGDLNGDGTSDLITAPRAGGGPHVKVYIDDSMFQFMAYDVNFRGGVSLAAADVDNDGRDEIITGAGPGGGPHVRMFEFNGAPVAGTGDGFFPYEVAFRGGVNVGGLRRSGADAVITGPGAGGGPHVRVFEPNGTAIDEGGFMAYDAAVFTGVNVSGLTVGSSARILTAPGPGGGPHVRVFDTAGVEQSAFMAYDPAMRAGVFVASLPRDNSTTQDILVGPAAGGPHLLVANASGTVLYEFMARQPATGGATVAGGIIR